MSVYGKDPRLMLAHPEQPPEPPWGRPLYVCSVCGTQAPALAPPFAAGLLLQLKAECEAQHARADAAERALAAPAPCAWAADEDGVWHTDCGRAFQFNEDGPTWNGHRFCGYCGKPLLVVLPGQ